jgi:lipopolysaccharide export system protein LptA
MKLKPKIVREELVMHIRIFAKRAAVLALFAGGVLFSAPRAIAQPKTPATGATRAGATPQFGANKQTLTANGIRLEGNAFIRRPELDVRASIIALEYSERAIKKVTARGKVFFRINLPASATAGAAAGKPARIEATCDMADLDPNLATRRLTLTGNVNGFYQIEGGPRNLLSGKKVTITYVGQNLSASSDGAVRVVVPAETFQNAGDAPSTAIGTVVIKADRANVDGATGQVTFAGNASAVSSDGPNKFNFSAPSFVLTRGANGTIDTLKSAGGRTRVKLDLPPDPAAPATASATSSASRIGRPTQLEAEADSVVVTRANNTVVFEGKVSGSYRLQPANAPAGDYKFQGDRAVIRYVPSEQATAKTLAGLQVEVTGNPSSIEAPQFELGF